MSDALNELFASWMDRNATEDWKRQLHRPLNEVKSQAHGQNSLAEWFVGAFATFVAKKRAEMTEKECAA